MKHKQRWRLIAAGVCLALLLAAVFTLGSLDVPFEQTNGRDDLTLYAVSSLITAALLIFLLILGRTAFRLWMESSNRQLGTRFKTKMVVGAMAISLLPILFMFLASYSLLNRTLGRWFPRPLEIAAEQSQALLSDLENTQLSGLRLLAREAQPETSLPTGEFLQRAFSRGADAAWILRPDGQAVRGGVICTNEAEERQRNVCVEADVLGKQVQVLKSGVELWQAGDETYSSARVGLGDPAQPDGYLVVGYRTSPEFVKRLKEIQAGTSEYYKQKQNLRALKKQMLLILLFFTVLLFFAVMWVALFLSKQVTVPIQALAEGTREVSAGNLGYQVPDQAHDELGVLVRSFNAMTVQLRDNRSQIDQFTQNLQQAVQELERRRQLMETVLENIPTGVVSTDSAGVILRANGAVTRMLGVRQADLPTLESLLGAEATRTVQYLMRRSLRMGVVSREIETIVSGRVVHLAVTVSAVGPRRANAGYVLVLDELTEMLRAQKSAAWQEVARRIAHEIKNPLTPIQLSAQRMSRFLERRESEKSGTPGDSEFTALVQECSTLIEREVSALATLVNEFSQFVRFPTAKLAPADVNTIVNEALAQFAGRLDGIVVKTNLAGGMPAIRADAALLRSVVVNLVDNAAEALENCTKREIVVSTRAYAETETVAISVVDTGHGISPEDKDKLFLPHFSTKDRGTGLGLAIAARIVAEHGGSIHVIDNEPVGSRFEVELPAVELTAATMSEQDEAESPR
ncbi:MAG: ATP-binding protein [Candidatus Acidiferrum sp.]